MACRRVIFIVKFPVFCNAHTSFRHTLKRA
jgi:hypothetical protein